jgi:3-hydroxybutyryl-CoA dehydratase
MHRPRDAGRGLISTALGKDLPGPGTIYLNRKLKFMTPLYVGETLTITLTVVGLRPEERIATLTTVGQLGDRQIIGGEAVVLDSREGGVGPG